jgi:hypothetical protein
VASTELVGIDIIELPYRRPGESRDPLPFAGARRKALDPGFRRDDEAGNVDSAINLLPRAMLRS